MSWKNKKGVQKKGGARSTGTPLVYATDQNGSQNRWDGGDKYYFVHTTIPRHVCPKKRLTTYSNFAQSSLLFYTIFLHKNNTHLDLTVFSGMSFCCSVETKIIHINGRVVLNTLSSCLKKAEAEICNKKGAMIHRFNPDKKQRLHAHI